MKKLLSIILILAAIKGQSQIPTWEWAKCPIGYGQGEGWSLAVDDIGNSYITGTFGDTLIYGSDTVIDFHGATVFVARYDANGNAIWARCSSGDGNSYGQGVATDDSGNVYVTGYYSGFPSIQFGLDTISSNGIYHDIFIVKYDSTGNLIWVRSFGGSGIDETWSIATDLLGNIFLAGQFGSPSIIFDSDTLFNSGSLDAFIIKLNSSGIVLWAKNPKGPDNEIGTTISTDVIGNAYFSGQFNSPQVIFDNDTLSLSGASNVFIAKYNPFGNVLWAQNSFGSTGIAYSIATNTQGKVIIAGEFDSTSISFAQYTLSPSAQYNPFVVQYDSSGTVDWAKTSTMGKGYGWCVVFDNCGNIDLAGSMYTSPITFDGITLFSSPINGDNMFLIQFCSTGQAIWGTTLPFGGDDQMIIATDQGHNIYLGGDFSSTPVNIGLDTLTNPIGEMPFVAKLNYSCAITSSCNVGILEGISSNRYILFPNPFNNSFAIELNDDEQSQMVISDILSRKLLQETFTKSMTINTEKLKSGIYIYELQNAHGLIASGKLIKQ